MSYGSGYPLSMFQAFSAEDLQGALPDTFAWSPPSSPSAFLPPTTSSTLENLVDGEVATSFQDTMAPSATSVATAMAHGAGVGVTNLSYPSSSSSGPLPPSSTPTSSTVAPTLAVVTPSPVTTVHYHGHSSGDGGSGQDGGGGGGGVVPTFLTNLPSSTTTSTTQASRLVPNGMGHYGLIIMVYFLRALYSRPRP